MSTRRRFTGDFKAKVALEALRGDKMIQEIATRHKVHPNQVSTWKQRAVEGMREVFTKGAERSRGDHEGEIRDLHAKIGELTVERDFLAKGLNETMVGFAVSRVRSYVSEPDRGRRRWKGKTAARDAVYANRRRIRGARGKRLLRQRGERLERPNAHLYETGGMRRVHLRGHSNILKRLLVHVCGFNLGLLMRQLTGVGTPRSLQGRATALLDALIGILCPCWGRVPPSCAPKRHDRPVPSWGRPATHHYEHAIRD